MEVDAGDASSATELWRSVTASHKLDRDRAVDTSKHKMKSDDAFVTQMTQILLAETRDVSTKEWTHKLGLLMAAYALLRHQKNHGSANEDLGASCGRAAAALLQDDEVRVRSAAGDVLGALCALRGVSVYLDLRPTMMDKIRENIERSSQTEGSSSAKEGEKDEQQRPDSPSIK